MTSRELTSFLPLADDGAWPADVRRSFSDVLHVMAYGAIGWPWLLKSLSGGTKAEKRRLIERLDLAPDALPYLGSWKADTGFLHLIVDHIEAKRPQTVVEFGAGASSLIVARALQRNGGGRHIACDQHAGFVDATREWLHDNGVDADLRATPFRPSPNGWPGVWYDHGQLPSEIDLLIIDGPPWAIHPYVRGAADSLFDRIPVGGMIMLDDAARPGERVVARKWKKRWSNFEFSLIHPGTKGTLIGTRIR
ncbi:class I SAM-dependent methyltransferase [Sphingomonas sp. G-3-2-10]|uniref:class I SAM-dependent methyltransferase n=1 Tax=Sphingomonas sp. G-3-2-10 TaxID=2728838 RepID=UPI00146C2951|nr:class I SAM-dependent methyltransferase [Sphingomonas sp. G-3-2-10]NML05926.1 class I SAM-dependent methyltransferase [Sphingomonas sp. G-3-2-10]